MMIAANRRMELTSHRPAIPRQPGVNRHITENVMAEHCGEIEAKQRAGHVK